LFVSLDQSLYTGHAYLIVAIYAQNVAGSNAYCWPGRVLCSVNTSGTGAPPANNGIINPTPTGGFNNFIDI
jgi:hypothetical protein